MEQTLLDIDEQLQEIERNKDDLLQRRFNVLREIRQATDRVVEDHFGDLLKQGLTPLGELSLEREILHAIFDNPLQSFVRWFGVDDLMEDFFGISDEKELKNYQRA